MPLYLGVGADALRMMGIQGNVYLVHEEQCSWVLGTILPVTVHRDSVCSHIFEQEKRKTWLSRAIKNGSLGMQVPGTIPCLGTGDDFGNDCYAAFTLIFDYECAWVRTFNAAVVDLS